MDIWLILVAGSAVIVVMLFLRALQVLRQEKDAPRGTAPGSGSTTIEAHYISGGGGGGQHSTYEVTKDPQEYARLFVPKDAEQPKGKTDD